MEIIGKFEWVVMLSISLIVFIGFLFKSNEYLEDELKKVSYVVIVIHFFLILLLISY